MTSRPDIEQRLTSALHAEVDALPVDTDSLHVIRRRSRVARRRRAGLVAGVGVLAVAAAALALPGGGRADDVTTDPAGPSTTDGPDVRTDTTPAESPDTTDVPTTVTSSEPPVTSDTTVVPSPPAYAFSSQPLWPFRTQDEADAWLADAAEGHSPWHADAAATAQAFTMNYLGFAEIDQIVDTDVRDREAWVHVGYESEPGVLSVAAVVHLVRFGPSADAPWEVVGTTDDALTLDTPRYGSPLSSPLIVGGTITGVDESIEVAVRQVSSPEPLGSDCCVPAGGERAWWETTIDVAGATDPAVTVVAWSGGHVQDVEVFAVTGLHR